jgi:hypothetical protein
MSAHEASCGSISVCAWLRETDLPHVAQGLASTAAAQALSFARTHADIDALLAYIHSDGIPTRDSVFEATLVPALLATAGRTTDARDAIAEYRRQLTGPEADDYERVASRLLARIH